MLRVLVADPMSDQVVRIFKERGIRVDVKTGLSTEALLGCIGLYEGLVVRSATKVTSKVLKAAQKLKVVGRAGIGVDNIDVKTATQRGVVVMNTPFGNAITTAEHAIAMMFAAARQIPQANQSTHGGKWEKSRFVGVEVFGKILGIIGCGNIGSLVATRAVGLKMKVIAFDPFLTRERAVNLGVEKVSLEVLLERADVITLHTPLTDKTRDIINAAAIAKMKKGVILINCARGGLVVEADLKKALAKGQVGAAALDVFEKEPAYKNSLFGMPNVICTPHLGASTTEAQEKVAYQIAEQMAEYLLSGAVANALNVPAISAEEAPHLLPFVHLAENLGLLVGQLVETSLKEVRIEYAGEVAQMNLAPLTAAALAGVLRPVLMSVNMVSAPAFAQERGIRLSELKTDSRGIYESYILLSVTTERQTRAVGGTVFSGGRARIIHVQGVDLESEFAPFMLHIVNQDKPGFVGKFGTLLGKAQVNIASFTLGRKKQGGTATVLVTLDKSLPEKTLAQVRALPHVVEVCPLSFPRKG